MAKTIKNKKTARKKKSTGTMFDRRNVQTVTAIRQVLNDMYLTFSSIDDGIRKHGMDKLSRLVGTGRGGNAASANRADKELSIARGTLLSALSEDNREWYYLVIAFLDDGDEISMEYEAGSIGDSVMADLTPAMPKLVEGVMKGFNPDHVKGWAWIATPSATNDLAASADHFIDWYMSRNILDQDKRKSAEDVRLDKYVDNIAA